MSTEVSSHSTPTPGPRDLGRYELIRRLAVGGMAEIFLAKATGIKGFEKMVVLKRILPHFAQDGEFVRMFLEEARLAATLHHPNIAQVFDIGKVRDTYFFTMEYVQGVDIRRLWNATQERRLRIPFEHAIAIIVGTAAGLHCAHDKKDSAGEPLGIVHRDVSPSNILVAYDGGVKVVDFGIAKATHQRNTTEPGSIRGKVAYMSPEQCQSQALDRRSDIFSIGILLYELTTGVLLFQGKDDLTVLRQITDQEIRPPSLCREGYPHELERIVMRALRKNPADRYPSAQALQRDLEAFALERKLPISALGLADYLAQLFGEDVAAWKEAERGGKSSSRKRFASGRSRSSSPGFDDYPIEDSIVTFERAYTSSSVEIVVGEWDPRSPTPLKINEWNVAIDGEPMADVHAVTVLGQIGMDPAVAKAPILSQDNAAPVHGSRWRKPGLVAAILLVVAAAGLVWQKQFSPLPLGERIATPQPDQLSPVHQQTREREAPKAPSAVAKLSAADAAVSANPRPSPSRKSSHRVKNHKVASQKHDPELEDPLFEKYIQKKQGEKRRAER